MVVRPLPQLTPTNEWFWTSGADGSLRIQRCADCQTLVHPPVPICPVCRSLKWEPSVVSGRGTVVGFTVNSHQWLPGFEPPYVIANVALAEDAMVRLTTNIVGCDPDEVHIGQEVAVRFDHQEDVWVPLFEPTGATDAIDRVAEPQRPTPRPPARPDRFEHRVVLSGVGRSAIGRRLMRDPLSLAVDACLAAVADAGLTLDDIDGLSTYPGPAPGGMTEGGVTAVEEALRLRPTWHNGGLELPGPGGAVDRRDARGGGRTVPSRPVLPHRVGVDLRDARPRRGCRRRASPDRSTSGGRRSARCRRRTGSA